MTAEKGEHERAQSVSDSYPTPLRATLRAPPSKWAIEAFFPAGEQSEPRPRTARRAPAGRSPRRAAGRAASGVAVPLAFFCTLFFRHRKKSVSAPWDGKSHSRAGVGASGPHKGNFHGKIVASRCLHGAFRSPPAPLRAVERKARPVEFQVTLPRRTSSTQRGKTLGITPVRGVSSIFSIASFPIRA